MSAEFLITAKPNPERKQELHVPNLKQIEDTIRDFISYGYSETGEFGLKNLPLTLQEDGTVVDEIKLVTIAHMTDQNGIFMHEVVYTDDKGNDTTYLYFRKGKNATFSEKTYIGSYTNNRSTGERVRLRYEFN